MISAEALSWILCPVVTICLYPVLPLLIAIWVLYVVWYYSTYFSNDFVDSSRKCVLITGCDSGFGLEAALRLDKFGFWVFAGCLDPKGDGAHKLKHGGSNRLHVVELDVTKEMTVLAAMETIENCCNQNNFNGLWGVKQNGKSLQQPK